MQRVQPQGGQLRSIHRRSREHKEHRIHAPSAAAEQQQQPELNELWPQGAVQQLQEGELDVGDGHTLYFRTYGNPDGAPALVLHGGPGAGCFPAHTRFFNPAKYFIVLFDQRGCGASSPRGRLQSNLTKDLVDDVESLREHLGVNCFLLSGGSWGCALALAYARRFPQHVWGLVRALHCS